MQEKKRDYRWLHILIFIVVAACILALKKVYC